ncbi:MAG: glycosyltransferase family 2 protein [Bacteroidaceae bacterium]|nr:glycosyltransferase family 2 protein [Bacteroidaceae bacterium]
MPKISVIVPVYNTEKYLHRCVDSILAQTFSDFELLLINDGSKDKSATICDEYAAKDSRVSVFHKENGGVSSARNLGLDCAKGEWITFVDSDDWLGNKYLENLIINVKRNIELVISFSYSVFKDKIGESKYESKVLNSDEFSLLFTEYDLSWRTSPWSKLYNNKIIKENKLIFNVNMPIGEDLVFLYEYITCVNKIYISGQSYYYYFADNENTLTKKINSTLVEQECLYMVNKTVNALLQKKNICNKEALDRVHCLMYSYINRVLNSLYYNNLSRKERLNVLNGINYTSYLYFWSIRKNNIKEKLFVFLISNRLFCVYDILRQMKKLIK